MVLAMLKTFQVRELLFIFDKFVDISVVSQRLFPIVLTIQGR